MDSKKSLIWTHFIIDESQKAECKYCEKPISFHGKTSNLIKHMNRKHLDVLAEKQKHGTIPASTEIEVNELKEQEIECDMSEINPEELEQCMERVLIVNFDVVCRICLSNLDSEVVHLSSNFSQDVTYQEMFKICTDFPLEEAEPRNVCSECAAKLQVAYELRRQCIETQKVLQEWLQTEAKESEDVVLDLEQHDECTNIETEEYLIFQENISMLPSPKPFECEMCGIRVSSKSAIALHIKTQHINFQLKCKYCESRFKSRMILNSHIRKIHSEIKSPFKCEYCEYTTPHFPNMFRHRITHTRRKVHECPDCGHEFITKGNLKAHQATHSDVRPFACEICEATFKTKKSLGVHLKTHRSPEYECPCCQRGFKTNQLMRSHSTRFHPEFVLPPKGTILNKTWRIKKATQELRENVARMGYDEGVVRQIIIDDSYLNSAKKYVRKNK